MSEIKLLPCPFCGGDNLGFYHNHLFRDGYEVRCYDCHFGLQESRTKQEAIEAWNTRKPMERIIERLEEELKLSDIEKERCIRENPLQFDEAKGYSTGISNAIDFVKEEGGIE